MNNNENNQTPAEAAGYIVGVTLSAFRGKPISASIIILAAAVLLVGGSYIQHSDTKLFLQVVGCLVLGFGLVGWLASGKEK